MQRFLLEHRPASRTIENVVASESRWAYHALASATPPRYDAVCVGLVFNRAGDPSIHWDNSMRRMQTKLLRLAGAIGAGLWLIRLVVSKKGSNEVDAAMRAIDEATPPTGPRNASAH
jgi:hypothetical protein